MTNEERWPRNRCEHCGCSYGYHEVGCPALIDKIVDDVTSGFREDIKRILGDEPEAKPGDLTTEQQCQIIADASCWRQRALKAEAALATPPTTDASERMREAG